MVLFKYRSSNITLNLCLKILQCMNNIYHMLHCPMLRRYVELNFFLFYFFLGAAWVALSDKHSKDKKVPLALRKGTDFSFSLACHYASAQLATTTPLILGNLAVLKISNPRALGEQGPTYQPGISIVKCTELTASKQMLFMNTPLAM